MSEDDYPVREATAEDVDVAAEVLAIAFTGYPWSTWTVDSEDHTRRLADLYRLVLGALVIPYGAAWVCEHGGSDGGRLVGAAGWLTPRSEPPPEVWQRLATEERRLRGTRLDSARRAEEHLEPLRPQRPHWLLGTVGVLPDHRGRGLAGRLVRPGMDAAAADGSPACLETSSRDNVRLYERLGFLVTATARIPGGGPDVWLMST